jgi:hypothetical protein
MHKILSVLFFFFIIPQQLMSQVSPEEGSLLNYRRVGFSFSVKDVIGKYKIEIAKGNYNTEDSFKKNIIQSVYTKTNRIIAEVPAFGSDYTWRIIYLLPKKSAFAGVLHHFSTGYIPGIDTCKIRLRIIKQAVKFKNDFVFVDGSNALYDMKGNPVWYIPVQDRKLKGNVLVRDLKISPQGTITFLLNQHAYEVNYNGDTLWRGPDNGMVNGEDSERYHHELTRLSNGHYMILGTEHVSWDHKVIHSADSTTSFEFDDQVKPDNDIQNTKKTPFGTIIEYDEKGNVVWSWKSSKYFMGSDIVNYRPEGKAKVIDVHENAFYFDEQNQYIYVSFRNISRILKIKYPDGNIISSYGEIFRPDTPAIGNGLFCEQHGIRRSKDGYLYLYNNNACNDDKSLPTVVIMKEPDSEKGNLVKVWEYECNIDGINVSPLMKKAFEQRKLLAKKNMVRKSWKGTLLHVTSGGNVIEMPDHSLFVCMNTQYSKIFIVNRDKKILWSAVPEKWNPGNNEWYITYDQYRASIVTPKELDNLIWNAEQKNNK